MCLGVTIKILLVFNQDQAVAGFGRTGARGQDSDAYECQTENDSFEFNSEWLQNSIVALDQMQQEGESQVVAEPQRTP